MKKQIRLFSFLFLSLGAVFVIAQELSANSITKPQSEENSLLWKVQKGDQVSFLFGTIHIIPSKDLFISDTLESIAKSVNMHVYEINLKDSKPLKLALKSMIKGGTIKDYLNADDYSRLQIYLEDSIKMVPAEIAMFNKMKPIFASQMIMLKLLNNDFASYEMSLMEYADKHKIKVEGLESAMEQMSILDSISIKDQAEMLMETVDGGTSIMDALNTMFELYKANDLIGLKELMEEDYEMEMEFSGVLLNNRNHKWIPMLEGFMSSQSCLIAVGAAHLPGEDGVIELLRDKGYTLTPIEQK